MLLKIIIHLSSDSGKDLSRRLGLLSSASQDPNNCKNSLSADIPVCPQIQEKREINKDDHILKIESIETVVKGDSISQSINENMNVNKIAGDISSTKDSSIIAKLLLNGVRCSILTNGSSESEGVKNAIRSAYIDTKLKISSEESAPRKKLKLTKESNDVVFGITHSLLLRTSIAASVRWTMVKERCCSAKDVAIGGIITVLVW